jgi:hypothetical protein
MAATGTVDKPNAAGLPMALPNAFSKLVVLVVVVVAHHRIGATSMAKTEVITRDRRSIPFTASLERIR